MIALFAALFFTSCTSEAVEDGFIAKPEPVPMNGQAYLIFDDVTYLLGAEPDTIPPGYTPKRTGDWDFDATYIYDDGEGNLWEIYGFSNMDELARVSAECDRLLEKELVGTEYRVKCTKEGNTCRWVSVDDCWTIVFCSPPV